jgi:hypothetical protein
MEGTMSLCHGALWKGVESQLNDTGAVSNAAAHSLILLLLEVQNEPAILLMCCQKELYRAVYVKEI